ncbi:Gamma-adducin [Acropora cervicornis]|uniref:Gamma-adducin n=1 Tax=Acropora cervicornis TaxID=6130 RepID=A0AAD9R3G8_ACRCE|nr:Gamma-adducin [Acropora cervicornis]
MEGIMRSSSFIALGEVSYHDFRGIFTNEEEKESIVKNLGDKNKVKAIGAGIDNLVKCDELAIQQVVETANTGGGGVDSGKLKWKRGEMEFEAWMRLLDSMGYKTGYVFKNPEIFHSEKPAEREVTTPSTVSSTRAKMFYTPEIERNPVRRAHSTGRANTYRNRVKWLNTPVKSTEYKKDKEKVELDSDEPQEEVVVKTTKVVITESSSHEKGMNGDETKEVKKVVITEVNGDAGDEKSIDDGDEDGPDGELLMPTTDGSESPTKKKGTKVKKKKSFRDALVKKFSKKGERPAKYVKNEGEKNADSAE